MVVGHRHQAAVINSNSVPSRSHVVVLYANREMCLYAAAAGVGTNVVIRYYYNIFHDIQPKNRKTTRLFFVIFYCCTLKNDNWFRENQKNK